MEEVVEVEAEVAHAQVAGTMATFNDQEVVLPVALPGVELPLRITSMTTCLFHRQLALCPQGLIPNVSRVRWTVSTLANVPDASSMNASPTQRL